MATLNFIKRKDVKNIESLGNVIAYCAQEYKTKYENSRLISGINCMPETAMKEFIATKRRWNKQDGVQYYYAVQSFDEGLKINPVLAHQIAREWAERCYPNHEVFIATHLDTDSVHSHIIINSVNMKTGRKIHQSTKELEEMRKVNDELCIKYGLPVCVPKKNQKVKTMKPKEYYIAMAGRSWKFQMINAIEFAMKIAKNKQEFIDEMDRLGYEIKWSGTRKNITYIEKSNPNRRCRDDNLHEEKFLKVNMEVEFALRERLASPEKEQQPNDFDYGESHIGNDSRERLLESLDRAEPKSKSSVELDSGGTSERRTNRSVFDTDILSAEQGNISSNGYNSGLAGQTADGIIKTGWESEREYALGIKQFESGYETDQEEAVTAPDWNTNRNTSVINDSLYFIGNVFEMINNQSRYHRKRFKLSQKEIEKRIAHGQKSDGYEEYEMTMY